MLGNDHPGALKRFQNNDLAPKKKPVSQRKQIDEVTYEGEVFDDAEVHKPFETGEVSEAVHKVAAKMEKDVLNSMKIGLSSLGEITYDLEAANADDSEDSEEA